MIVKVADNIVSPLGFSSLENYHAVRAGKSELRLYEGRWQIPEPFVASLFDYDKVDEVFKCLANGRKTSGNGIAYTHFEKISILSAAGALADAGIDPSSPEVLFVLSTTKGNVELLDKARPDCSETRALLDGSARAVAGFFENPNMPIVVSNACISGLCAQITAIRYLQGEYFKHAVVIGADCQSAFIVAGFQSFKSLAPHPCRPFDASREGLNLGEAAACLIYSWKERAEKGQWILSKGAIRNDANHISGPSRVGEGCYRALSAILQEEDLQELALLNAHGTATLYNDEMESIAIDRMGLNAVPVNSLKGYYGHTMGAAGVLETILSMYSVEDGVILPTRGFESCGVSRSVSVCAEERNTDKRNFIKMLSGFGGCNAAVLFKLQGGLEEKKK